MSKMEIDKKTIALLMVLLVFVSLMGSFIVMVRASEIQSVRLIDEGSSAGRVSLNVRGEALAGMSSGVVSLAVE